MSVNVIIDTPGWSEVFRRSSSDSVFAATVAELIAEGKAVLIGPVRQEVLSGVRDPKQARKLQDALRAFSDLPIERVDYETAASYFNTCRSQGVQGTHTDFLICALSVRYSSPILTSDRDFEGYSAHVPIRLFDLS